MIAVSSPKVASPSTASRTAWVDNLRTLIIVLVVNFHACITYSHVGDWYYLAPPKPAIGPTVAFAMWEGLLQSFFMGLLFFVAGYWADRSLARRGPRSFVAERLRRLGIPVLIYMLAIHPLIAILIHPLGERNVSPWVAYGGYLLSGRFVDSNGPMWFALALLIFSLVFASVRFRTPRIRLTAPSVLLFAAAIGVATFFVRLVQPIGTDILNLRLGFFPQYIAAFILGVGVSRHDTLNAIAESRLAKHAGYWGLVFGPVGLMGVAAMTLPLPKTGLPPFTGGWNFPALVYSVWEQLAGFALALGTMALCVRRLAMRTPFTTWLSERTFGVYLLHSPILVALALALQPVRGSAFPMSIVLTALGLPLSFAAADLARRIPGLRTVL